jgi:hypothetical protein
VPATLLSTNFNVKCQPGKLIIQKKQITIRADDKIVDQDDQMPVFTSVVSGYAPGETESHVFVADASGRYIQYESVTVTGPGSYPIIPNATLLSPPNYDLHIINGTLYVNPKGAGVKAVKPIMECVEVVDANSNPGRFVYRARFSYQNDNSATVYVTEADSRLTGTSFAGTAPRIFLPGRSAPFYVFFDGNKLTWTINSNGGTRKTSVASSASSTSARCKNTSARVDNSAEDTGEPLSLMAYPNPAHDQLIIHLPEDNGQQISITLLDVQGKISLQQKAVCNAQAEIEIDVAPLKPGLYLVRIERNNSFELIKIIKQ